jgi:hypothetical protein
MHLIDTIVSIFRFFIISFINKINLYNHNNQWKYHINLTCTSNFINIKYEILNYISTYASLSFISLFLSIID